MILENSHLASQGLHEVFKCNLLVRTAQATWPQMCLEGQSTIVCVVWSRKTHMHKVWLQAEYIAGALSMLSIHSPDYLFTVLLSILISKTHNHFLSSILVL